jgi:hypothetical protein
MHLFEHASSQSRVMRATIDVADSVRSSVF